MLHYNLRLYPVIALLVGVSATVILSTADTAMVEQLRMFRPRSIGLAMVFLAIGMYFDCARLIRLLRMVETKITFRQSLAVILSNYFFAMLTPGATCGPVAQVLVLRELQVPIGCASVLVMIRTMLSIVFLIVCVPVVLWLDTELVWLIPVNVVAIAAGAAVLLLGSIKCVHLRVVKRLLLRSIVHLGKVRRRAIWRLYRDVSMAIGLLRSQPCTMAMVLVQTALSLIFLYAIVPALFWGLGVQVDWVIVLGRMILLNLVLYFAPTPGGSGVAEGGFVYLFDGLLPSGTVGVLAVAWRILAEYLPFAGGMYFSLKLWGEKL